jgi:hypothetical protein
MLTMEHEKSYVIFDRFSFDLLFCLPKLLSTADFRLVFHQTSPSNYIKRFYSQLYTTFYKISVNFTTGKLVKTEKSSTSPIKKRHSTLESSTEEKRKKRKEHFVSLSFQIPSEFRKEIQRKTVKFGSLQTKPVDFRRFRSQQRVWYSFCSFTLKFSIYYRENLKFLLESKPWKVTKRSLKEDFQSPSDFFFLFKWVDEKFKMKTLKCVFLSTWNV